MSTFGKPQIDLGYIGLVDLIAEHIVQEDGKCSCSDWAGGIESFPAHIGSVALMTAKRVLGRAIYRAWEPASSTQAP